MYLATVIAAVWVLLCGAGYLLRVACGLRPAAAAAGVVGLYLACDAAALWYLGLNGTGVLGCAGMAVPCLATIAGVVLWR